MKHLSVLALLVFCQSAFAHEPSEIKTAACSDSIATTFVRLDRTGANSIMYGVFYQRPTVSNSYAQPLARVQFTPASRYEKYDAFSTEAVSEKQEFAGTLSLSFLATAPLAEKGLAFVSFLDASGNVTSADVECELSY